VNWRAIYNGVGGVKPHEPGGATGAGSRASGASSSQTLEAAPGARRMEQGRSAVRRTKLRRVAQTLSSKCLRSAKRQDQKAMWGVISQLAPAHLSIADFTQRCLRHPRVIHSLPQGIIDLQGERTVVDRLQPTLGIPLIRPSRITRRHVPRRVVTDDGVYPRQDSSTKIAWTSLGPWTPRMRICSISAVRLGPVMKTTERPGRGDSGSRGTGSRSKTSSRVASA
jgi:hypothetical protein